MLDNKRLAILGLVVVSLLLAGCGAAGSSQGSPTVAVEPTPTNTVAANPTPTPSPAVSQKSALVQLLGNIPRAFSESGIWFGDSGRALELAGITTKLPATPEEFGAYMDATNGVLTEHVMLGSYQDEFKDVFGYGQENVFITLMIGPRPGWPFATAYTEGSFDAKTIVQKLLEIGYHERQVSGFSYYAIREDRDVNREAPGSFVLADMNRVYVDEDTVLRSPDTAPVESMLKVWARETPSLAESPSFAAVAAALGDPLSAALLTASAAMDTSTIGGPELAKQEGWGPLGEWDALGAGYSKTGDARTLTIVLHYPDGAVPEGDGEELLQRLASFEVHEVFQRGGWPSNPFDAWCASVGTSTQTPTEGGDSVLVVECLLKEEATGPGWLLALVENRDIAFLAP